MAVVMEVANHGHGHTHVGKAARDFGDCACRFVVVDGDANELTTGSGEICDLKGGRDGVGGIRVRHRLHDNRICGPDGDVADECGWGLSAGNAGQLYWSVVKMKANSLA
jgi:hypothetical protein